MILLPTSENSHHHNDVANIMSPMSYMSHITYSVWHFNIQALYMEIILLLDNDNHAYYLLYFHKFLFKSIIRRC